MKDKDKEKPIPSIKKQQQDATRREAAGAKRMQELMRQFSTILRQAHVKPCNFFFLCVLSLYAYLFLITSHPTIK